ncbi:MAG: hypothetical protein JXR11_07125 [Balneola sp.]
MNKEKEFSVEYSLKWGPTIGMFIQYGFLPIITIFWILTIIIVDINWNTILDVLIVTAIFLLAAYLTISEIVKKEKITIKNDYLFIETSWIRKKRMWKYDLREIYKINLVPKEYLWHEIYGIENPMFARYKMTFKYKKKEIWFADGMDYKTAFSVLSKMKESQILEEKLNQKSSL